ncbi:dTDP-glucose 4,6-dehydratase 2 [bioreactor metagenome]|uniref:dTDP-glucose 4,6-dehydratase 2 n=1 Tax=bioreactor metagenome TaxID=1076179 RepID=A0A645A1I1_9ZZZZ
MISRALSDASLPVYGKGENVRDWLHVYDHCSAIDLIVRKGRIGEIYNIGGHNERNNMQIIRIILQLLNKPESLITFVTDRPGHDLRYAIDATKIRRELNWQPKYSFDTGIQQTVEWYLSNQDWWKNIISEDYQDYYQRMYEGR